MEETVVSLCDEEEYENDVDESEEDYAPELAVLIPFWHELTDDEKEYLEIRWLRQNETDFAHTCGGHKKLWAEHLKNGGGRVC